jgi:hypothetical protein
LQDPNESSPRSNLSAKKLASQRGLPNHLGVTLLAKLLLALGAGLIILALV